MPRTDRLLLQQAYKEIKERIITLQLLPGQRIEVPQLAAELELSRTPMREAMFLLSSEGLIDTTTKAGFMVRPLDLLDVAELFEAHIVVAKAVARLAASRSTEADLDLLSAAAAQVDEAISRHDILAITSSNADLHRLEAQAARSRHLQGMANTIHDQEQRLAYLCFGGGGKRLDGLDEHFQRVHDDHAELLAAYRGGDVERAERVATAHVGLFRERVQAYIGTDVLEDFSPASEEFGTVSAS